MNTKFVGRIAEKKILNKALASDEAELIAIIGRRRVGKTFLVRSTYADKIQFEIAGIQNGSLKEQLQNFSNHFNIYAQPDIPYSVPRNWLEAFQMLILYFSKKNQKENIVLFFDELPWIATRRSGFLKAFGVFWNSWASRNNVVVVICGSAASWMIQKVVRDKGGLHNRITRRIRLLPFTLAETDAYFKSRSLNLDHYQTIQLYMAMGGIPHYLKEIERGQSAAQNIDRIFFEPSGFLREEFNLLYPALFENAEQHIKVIKLLAKKWHGLTRSEIVSFGKFSNGGGLSKVLEELNHSGFITPYYTFGKGKSYIRYRLTDEYSMFYLKFIENKRIDGEGMWKKFSQTQTYKIWTGYAFETLCLKHIATIKKALGISGVYAEASTFRSQKNDDFAGIQVDLIIDRNDHVINLLELKFYNSEFTISKTYAKELRNKVSTFKSITNTKKQIFLNFLSTFGIHANQNSLGLVDEDLTMEILFD